MLNYSANGPSGYNLTNSLRFRASNTAYLSRTPATATNRSTWTWSAWIKRGTISASYSIFSVGSGANITELFFTAGNILRFYDYISSTYTTNLETTQVFRDPSAWYHIIVAYDTTQATAANRVKLYVNGSQITSFGSATYPSQNYASGMVNSTTAANICGAGQYFDGYLTEVNFIDGQALTPSSFGNTNSVTGVWQPAKYTGTYGTNGFYLPFTPTTNPMYAATVNSFSTYAGQFLKSNYITTPSNAALTFGTGAFQMECWIYPTETPVTYAQILNGDGGNGVFWGYRSGNLDFVNNNDTAGALSMTFPTLNTWTHVAVVRNSGGTVSIYKNGTREATASNSFNWTQTFFWIGSLQAIPTAAFMGGISNLRVIKGSNTYDPTQTTITVPTSALTAVSGTSLLTLQNSTLIDNSTNAFTLTSVYSIATQDASGNFNNWIPNNINVTTSGTTYDAMTDVPTLTSATVANYATLSAIDYKTTAPSNGGLTEVAGNGIFGYARATQALPSSNKTYAECTVLNNVSNSAQFDFGVATNDVDVSAIPTTNSWLMEFQTTAPRRAYSNGSLAFSIGGVLVAGDTCQIAFDMSTGNGWMGVNNVWYNSTGGTTGDPSTGANPTFTGLTGLTLFPVVRVYGQQVDLNFGQRTFTYTPPTGYVRLNTFNLPSSTIPQGNKVMDATTFTGTSGAQSIVNAGAFKPDLVWTKARSNAQSNYLVDSVRGGTSLLRSEAANAESTSTSPAYITSFNSNGYSSDSASMLTNAYTYVGWQWQAGQGSTSSNTNGSITSTVSVNTTAGFSIATFNTGSSGAKTVGHGLGVKPAMLIFKDRSNANNWLVWHQSYSNQAQGHQVLNATSAVVNDATIWNNTAPTSTVASITSGYGFGANANVVMYAWAEIAGFSKFGSYTGNGSADGPFVYTGFRPKFILIKSTGVESWSIVDTSRSLYNQEDASLFPNLSNAEGTGNTVSDILSNGFKLRNTWAGSNTNAQTYIYIAFAENPFKNSLAR